MLRHLGLIAVCGCLLGTAGCDRGNVNGPSPPVANPITTVLVEFGGRVVNAETGGPVANVRVSVTALASRGGGLSEARSTAEEIASTGGDGTFALRLNDVPSDWTALGLEFTGPTGYDTRGGRLEPTAAPCRIAPCWATADRPAIRMYPTLVIRPGESIEVRVEDIVQCGWGGELGPCRRVLVAASRDDPVEFEVVPQDSSNPMALGLAIPTYPYIEPNDMSVRRLMVPPGGVPYVIGAGTATLTARR